MNFLIFCQADDWLRYARRPHLAALSKYGRMLIIEAPLSMRALFKPKKIIRWWQQKRYLRRIDDNIYIFQLFNPFQTVKIRNFILRLISFIFTRYILYSKMKIIGFHPDVSIFTSFWQIDYLAVLKNSIKCYELNDDYSPQYPPSADSKSIIRKQRLIKIIESVDVVFSVTENLKTKYEEYNRNIFLVPNCCDYDLFYKSNNKSTSPLSEFENINNPIIGTISGLCLWIDLDLLCAIIKHHPEWTIVFSAGIDRDFYMQNRKKIDYLISTGSLKILPWVEYEKLPNFIKSIDICAFFYKKELIVCPNKLYMFLASGKPIVSLDIFDRNCRYGELVYISRDYEEFIETLEDLLRKGSDGNEQKRIKFARDNSCVIRAKQKIKVLKDLKNRFPKK